MESSRSAGSLARHLTLPLERLDPALVLGELLTAWRELEQTRTVEATKRAGIAARERVSMAEIQARQTLLMTYLERSFDERRLAFSELFVRADRALEQGDSASLSAVMGAVTELARSTPFRDIGNLEATQASLRSGVTWEI